MGAWLEALLVWFVGVPAWAWTALSVGSLLVLLLSAAALPRVVARMPIDWFERPRVPLRTRLQTGTTRARLRILARNGLGVSLMCCGAVLLLLPGQGLLTMVVGAMLTDLPVRDRLIRRTIRRRALASGLQKIRAWAGAPPFTGLPGAPLPADGVDAGGVGGPTAGDA